MVCCRSSIKTLRHRLRLFGGHNRSDGSVRTIQRALAVDNDKVDRRVKSAVELRDLSDSVHNESIAAPNSRSDHRELRLVLAGEPHHARGDDHHLENSATSKPPHSVRHTTVGKPVWRSHTRIAEWLDNHATDTRTSRRIGAGLSRSKKAIDDRPVGTIKEGPPPPDLRPDNDNPSNP